MNVGPFSVGMAELVTHSVRLRTRRLLLRPMTEDDWATLLRWNQDPKVLVWSDGGNVEPWSVAKLRSVYRKISHHAFMFIIEFRSVPIGDCWVQEMNLPEVKRAFRGVDVRRIDIAIGRSDLWGKGLGTEAVRALVRFAFQKTPTKFLFACDVHKDNPRSRRSFEKNGFHVWVPKSLVAGKRASATSHMMLSRDGWTE
jgi:aminoglycoside 6'-N-acetyltransferase